jgi:hypothetical protein
MAAWEYRSARYTGTSLGVFAPPIGRRHIRTSRGRPSETAPERGAEEDVM